MRKSLKATLGLLLVPAALIGGSTAAQASVNTYCYTYGGAQACGVQETMNSGYCSAYVNQSGSGSSFAFLSIVDGSKEASSRKLRRGRTGHANIGTFHDN